MLHIPGSSCSTIQGWTSVCNQKLMIFYFQRENISKGLTIIEIICQLALTEELTIIRIMRRTLNTLKTTITPNPLLTLRLPYSLRISIIISQILKPSGFKFDLRNIFYQKSVSPSCDGVIVYCLIILRNYQLVCTWALIFINIDNERVEASWLASSTMYILLNILIS